MTDLGNFFMNRREEEAANALSRKQAAIVAFTLCRNLESTTASVLRERLGNLNLGVPHVFDPTTSLTLGDPTVFVRAGSRLTICVKRGFAGSVLEAFLAEGLIANTLAS